MWKWIRSWVLMKLRDLENDRRPMVVIWLTCAARESWDATNLDPRTRFVSLIGHAVGDSMKFWIRNWVTFPSLSHSGRTQTGHVALKQNIIADNVVGTALDKFIISEFLSGPIHNRHFSSKRAALKFWQPHHHWLWGILSSSSRWDLI